MATVFVVVVSGFSVIVGLVESGTFLKVVSVVLSTVTFAETFVLLSDVGTLCVLVLKWFKTERREITSGSSLKNEKSNVRR